LSGTERLRTNWTNWIIGVLFDEDKGEDDGKNYYDEPDTAKDAPLDVLLASRFGLIGCVDGICDTSRGVDILPWVLRDVL